MNNQEQVLVELPRGDNDVLRVARKMYEGRPFTDVRVFFRGVDGALHPTKKGASIRDSEIHRIIDALQSVADQLEGLGK